MTALRLASGLVLSWLAGCGPSHGSIGAVFAQSRADGKLRVRDAPSDLPAARAGVRAEDEVLLIDGRDVRILSALELHALLSGPVGSRVQLTLLRAGTIHRMAVPRETIAVDRGASR